MRHLALLALALSLTPPPAFAANLVFSEGGTVVRLYDTPCTDKRILAMVRNNAPAMADSMMAGSLNYQGRELALCWTMPQPGVVFVVDSEGDAGAIPAASFSIEKHT